MLFDHSKRIPYYIVCIVCTISVTFKSGYFVVLHTPSNGGLRRHSRGHQRGSTR